MVVLKFVYLLTYLFTELSPSRGAVNYAATQELPSSLWNPKVQCRVHNSPPLVRILSKISPIHTILSYLRSILILSIHLHLGLLSGLYPSGFPINILYAFLFAPFVLHASSHPPSRDHSNYTWRKILVMKNSSLCSFFPTS
jgi:hypothetical protein